MNEAQDTNQQPATAPAGRVLLDPLLPWIPGQADNLLALAGWKSSHPVLRWVPISLYVGAAGVLVARAMAGALVRPLGPIGFVLATFTALWLGFTVWAIARQAARRRPKGPCGKTHESCRPIHSSPATRVGGMSPTAQPADVETARPSHPESPASTWPSRPHWDRPPAAVRQQWVRRRMPSGRELIEGTFRVSFAAGQTRAIEHIAFCPALATAPEIECRATEGEPVTIRVEQRTTFGARLALHLSGGCDEPHAVAVEFRVLG